MDLFAMNSMVLVILLVVVIGGAIAAGVEMGRRIRSRGDSDADMLGVVEGALLGLVGLLLAFGLNMAVDRYETRRVLVVQEANDIGTTHLRAALLEDEQRRASEELLVLYAERAVAFANTVPDTPEFWEASAAMQELHGNLWKEAADAIRAAPTEYGPRLYVQALNPLIDTHTERVASLQNRVPSTVMIVLVLGSAISVGMMALYVQLLRRSTIAIIATGALVAAILLVMLDLDRPERGFITVPEGPLVEQLRTMGG